MKLIVLFILGFLGLANAQDAPQAPPAPAQNTEVASLLEKVRAKYKSIDTYSSSGTVVADIDSRGNKLHTTVEFSIKLKKPNLYLITWIQSGVLPAGMIQSGAVWSDGTQPYLYMGVMKAYAKMGNDETALGAATGISDGAAYTIPSLILSVFADKTLALSTLKNPAIEKIESIGGDDCYVLTGSTTIFKKETYWISTSSNLILKRESLLERQEGAAPPAEISDADLEKVLRGTGQPVTGESKKRIRDMMQKAHDGFKTGDLSCTSTETQTEISSPDLTAKDFQFTPPDGTQLKDSLFDGAAVGPTEFTKPAQLTSGATSSYETVEAPVIKVFTTKDGDNKFIAYLVQWKGAEVIVSDPLARSVFKVGDKIKFIAQKIVNPKFTSLSFTLL